MNKREYIKAGFLVKQGHVVRNWKKRYFVLTTDELSYYSDDSLKSKKNTIPLQSLAQAHDHPDIEGKSFCFVIIVNGTEYIMSAESAHSRQDWIRAITAACKHENILQTKMIFSRALTNDAKEDDNGYYQKLLTNFFNSSTTPDLLDSLYCLISYFSRNYSKNQLHLNYEQVLTSRKNLINLTNKKRSEARSNLIWLKEVQELYDNLLQILTSLQDQFSVTGEKKLLDGRNSFDSPSSSPSSTSSLNRTDFNSNYKLIARLGAGAFAIVHEAINLKSGQSVAVKCISKTTLSKLNMDSVLNEIRIMSTLNHPNILKLYEFYDEQENICIVTELAKGGELFEKIVQKKKYSESEAKEIIQIIVKAIQYCHNNNVVHRDLKPENILFNSDGVLKIADFGFAKDLTLVARLQTDCGSPWYVAPEVLECKPYGAEVDIWSIGVIIYVLLSGFPPFYDKNQNRLFKKIRAAQYQFISPFWDTISDDAKDLIKHILVIDPRVRYGPTEILSHKWFIDNQNSEQLPTAISSLNTFIKTSSGKTIYSGYLTKKGGIIPNWKRRFFELLGDGLYYYADQSSPSYKGFISISNIKGITVVDQFNFTLHTTNRDYYIQADSVYDRDVWKEWILNITRCYQMIKRTKSAIDDNRIISAIYLINEVRRTPGMLFNPELISLWISLVDHNCEVASFCSIWPSNNILKFCDNTIVSFCSHRAPNLLLYIVADNNGYVYIRSITSSNHFDKISQDLSFSENISGLSVNPSSNSLFCLTMDNIIHSIDLKSFKEVYTFKELSKYTLEKIYSPQGKTNIIFVASDNIGNAFIVYNTHNYKQVPQAKCKILSICLHDIYLSLSDESKSLDIYDSNTIVKLYHITLSSNVTCMLAVNNEYLCVGDESGILKYYSLLNGVMAESHVALSSEYTECMHKNGVQSLLMNEDKSCLLSIGKSEIILWKLTPLLYLEAACNWDGQFTGGMFMDKSRGVVLANDTYVEQWNIDFSYKLNGKIYYPPLSSMTRDDMKVNTDKTGE